MELELKEYWINVKTSAGLGTTFIVAAPRPGFTYI